MQFQEINEYVVQEAITAKKVELKVEVLLKEKAIVRAYFYNDENLCDPVAVKIVIVEGEDYKAWGQDDTYLETLAFEKLGLNKISIPTPLVETSLEEVISS